MEQDRLEAFMTLITSASRSITKLKSRGMAVYGLGSTHTACVRVLYNAPNGLTRTQLSNKCELDKAQISRIVGELEEKGFVSESPGASSYKKRILLTNHGKRIAEDINRLVLDINTLVSGEIPDEDIETFYRVFGIICKNLKAKEDYFSEKPANADPHTN